MSFKLENFKIGVNENGFHFQDTETGVIFTVRKVYYREYDLAICMSSADETVCRSLEAEIGRILDKYCFKLKEKQFGNIELEKCYISESQNLFVLKDFAGDGISIEHLKTNKFLGLEQILEGKIPEVAFSLASDYDYEDAVKDFFELCSSDIKEIFAGKYRGKKIIKRTYSMKKIKQELLKGLTESVEKNCMRKTALEYEVTADKIIINKNALDTFSRTEIKHLGNYWYVNAEKESQPIFNFVYAIQAVKKYSQINKVKFCYKLNGKYKKVWITQKNADTVLKNAIKKRLFCLDV